MPFTRGQKIKYLEEPSKCPYCGFDQIEGGDLNFETGSLSQEIRCNACDKGWYDVYKLVTIEER